MGEGCARQPEVLSVLIAQATMGEMSLLCTLLDFGVMVNIQRTRSTCLSLVRVQMSLELYLLHAHQRSSDRWVSDPLLS